jgi:hypothetical protein
VYGRNILSREKRDLPIIYQPNERYEKIVRSFESALPEFERLAYENDFEIMYVIIPSREQVDDIKWEGLLAERVEVEEPQRFAIQNDVTLALEKSGSKYVDLTPYFVRLNENNSFYYNVDGHLNTKGHELAAAVIERKLQGIIG